MPTPRRVVISGTGWITPLGHSIDTVWSRLLKGDSGVASIEQFDASTFATNFAAEVRGFKLENFLRDPTPHVQSGPSTQFALAAAQQAWTQSGLGADSKLRRNRVGLYLGAGDGSVDHESFFAVNLAGWNAETKKLDSAGWLKAATQRLHLTPEIEQEPNLTLAHLATEFGCRGPAINCMTACAASTQAIGEAYEIIRRGDAEVMLAGGAHTMIHPLGLTGFIRLTAMSQRTDSINSAARPFDQTRDGFVMGEGAGMLVLEELDHAKARGATPLAEVVGFGSTADAFRITDIQPQGKGAQATMHQALRQAGLSPREIGDDGRPAVHYISAHGTGTKENDKIETLAVKGVFGPLAGKIPFSSVKSMLGHLIQAAGAVELITCVMAIKTGWVPPTMNLVNADPDCDLDYVPNQARDLNPMGGVQTCLSNSFGFGGQNDTLIVRKYNT